jgi:chemotaxis protein MotB
MRLARLAARGAACPPMARSEPKARARSLVRVRLAIVSAFLVSLVLPGCVRKDLYDAALADAKAVRAQLAERERSDQAKIDELQRELSSAQTRMQEFTQRQSDLSTADHNLQAELDQSTAINANLRAELERLGKNVDSMLREKGTMSKALDDAKMRLEELRKAQAAAEARAQLFEQFVQKLRKMIDAGQLKVVTRAGKLVIQLSNDVLFASGRTELKPAGKDSLTQLAHVLTSVRDRQFQVAGHTDNVPIQASRYASNWELSTARALAVVNLLVSQGVAPHQLSAAGFGEFDPIASNETPDGRAKNRRIEITLQPNLNELVAAPDIK